ncbi:MAG: tetratricopeptide repeat protein [Planctomycetota bacterium]
MAEEKRNGTDRQAHDIWDDIQVRIINLGRHYGRHVLVVLIVAIAVLIGYHNWHQTRHEQKAATWKELGQLPNIQTLDSSEDKGEELQKIEQTCTQILTERWETDATPWVMLKLARVRIASDNIEAARETLQTLLEDYPQHQASEMASRMLAGVMEQLGEYKQAARLYETLVERQDDTDFWMDAGRAWEMAGDRDRALDAYDEFLETNDDSPVASFRYARLKNGAELLSPPPETDDVNPQDAMPTPPQPGQKNPLDSGGTPAKPQSEMEEEPAPSEGNPETLPETE